MKEKTLLQHSSKFIEIEGAKLHYIETGQGDPILFLHGIPTSSHLWRNILPHLSSLGRCIAFDLIGFGRSEKPDIQYSIVDHIKYVEGFIKALNLKNITLVMHGLGSIIGFDYAMRHEKNCKGLVFYEAFLRPLSEEEEVSLPFQEQLIMLGKEQNEPDIILNGVNFVDQIISQNIMQPLPEEEMEVYREPFKRTKDARPILQYFKEISSLDRNDRIEKLIADYSKKLTQSKIPKLMLYSVPGFMTTINNVMWAKKNLPNLEIIDIGEELHLAQESNPTIMGESISVWLQGVEQMHY